MHYAVFFAVLGGADVKGFFELFGELVDIGIADFFGDFAGASIDVVEQSLGE